MNKLLSLISYNFKIRQTFLFVLFFLFYTVNFFGQQCSLNSTDYDNYEALDVNNSLTSIERFFSLKDNIKYSSTIYNSDDNILPIQPIPELENILNNKILSENITALNNPVFKIEEVLLLHV